MDDYGSPARMASASSIRGTSRSTRWRPPCTSSKSWPTAQLRYGSDREWCRAAAAAHARSANRLHRAQPRRSRENAVSLQLEGHDPDWQDVGTRRQAFYSDLAPGDYRFRVIAANNSGVWNDAGASVQFTIAPAYYQTTWFLALSLGTVLALVWSAYRIRIRVVEKHQREISALNERLMKAQEQERIRIAGELHDGVMQQMLAMTMMLGTAKRRIADDSEARPTLEKISDKLVEVGSDIRRLSHDLHPPILQEAGLPQAMRAYCEQFSASCGIPVSCDADDGLDDLSRGAALALFRIMQEALGNAAKHAQARRITVRLTRSADVVTLRVVGRWRGSIETR